MPIASSKKRTLILTALAVLLLGLFALAMTRVGPLAPTQVTVVTAQEGVFTPQLFGIGTVEARRSWMIGPTVAGRVLSVKVDVGDTVKAGQWLAEMDPVDLDQRLASLEATIDRTANALASAKAQQTDAQAKRELAVSNLRRNQDLADKQFISSTALETVVQTRISADAALEASRANVLMAEQDLIRAKADKAALLQQKASVRLMATADGVVTTREAEPGSTVVAGQAVLRIMDPSSLWLKLRVDQGRSSGLAPGLKAQIVLRSKSHQTLTGSVARLELLGDSVAEERVAQLTFDTLPAGVAVGEMAQATLDLPPIAPSVLIPLASIHKRDGQTVVWRLEAGKPVLSMVKVGATSLGGQAQILEGLKAGDVVVVHSQKPLSKAMRLKVVEAIVKPATDAGVSQ